MTKLTSTQQCETLSSSHLQAEHDTPFICHVEEGAFGYLNHQHSTVKYSITAWLSSQYVLTTRFAGSI